MSVASSSCSEETSFPGLSSVSSAVDEVCTDTDETVSRNSFDFVIEKSKALETLAPPIDELTRPQLAHLAQRSRVVDNDITRARSRCIVIGSIELKEPVPAHIAGSRPRVEHPAAVAYLPFRSSNRRTDQNEASQNEAYEWGPAIEKARSGTATGPESWVGSWARSAWKEIDSLMP